MTPEGKVLDRIVAKLRALQRAGAKLWYIKLHGGPMQRAGLPDLHVCYEGRPLYLEVKSPVGKTTPLQDHTLSAIGHAGGTVAVVRSVEDVMEVLHDPTH